MQSKRVWAEIDLDALKSNVENIKSTINSGEYMAVVKADAYGHGAVTVSRQLEKMGINHFAVSNIDEAQELRRGGIVGEILILGFTDPGVAIDLFEQNITQAVFSLEYAKILNAEAGKVGAKIPVHIKIDSGMGRIGFNCRNDENILSAAQEIEQVLKLQNLMVKGMFTHFAVADSNARLDISYTREQYERFLKIANEIKLRTGANLILHCTNTAGTVLHQDTQLNLNRIGISMYGLTPDPSIEMPIKLSPVMSLKAVISQIKTINKGDTVSYGRTYQAEAPTVVATIPVGYADGYHRNLSNKASVLVDGKKAPIIGRVCMDQLMVDVTGINAHEGDTVELFGKNLPVEELAELSGTINYEMVCSISRRVPRIYIKNGKIIRIENYLLG